MIINLGYDNLKFYRDVIFGLDSAEYNYGAPLQITSVKHTGKGFWLVISPDIIVEGEYNIQKLVPSKYETILVPKMIETRWNAFNAPKKYYIIMKHNNNIFVTPKAMFLFHLFF